MKGLLGSMQLKDWLALVLGAIGTGLGVYNAVRQRRRVIVRFFVTIEGARNMRSMPDFVNPVDVATVHIACFQGPITIERVILEVIKPTPKSYHSLSWKDAKDEASAPWFVYPDLPYRIQDGESIAIRYFVEAEGFPPPDRLPIRAAVVLSSGKVIRTRTCETRILQYPRPPFDKLVGLIPPPTSQPTTVEGETNAAHVSESKAKSAE